MKIFNELLEEVIAGQISFSRLRQMIKMIDKKPDKYFFRANDAAGTFKPKLLPHDITRINKKLSTFFNTMRRDKNQTSMSAVTIQYFSVAKVESISFVGVMKDEETHIHRPVYQLKYKDGQTGISFTYGSKIQIAYNYDH